MIYYKIKNYVKLSHSFYLIYFDVTKTPSAIEFNFDISLSLREVSITGAFAPITIPAVSPCAKNVTDLYKTFPHFISGTSKISTFPATGLSIFLCFAASTDIALSSAKGPPTIQFLISPRLHISYNSFASTVSIILGFTFSFAQIHATLGSFISIDFATSTAFSIICFFVFKSGAIFIAGSVSSINLS